MFPTSRKTKRSLDREVKKIKTLKGDIVPCAIDRTEMVAAFPGEVLEVIQV